MIERITFQEVKIHAEKVIKCSSCGKRLIRRKKFWETINPWNKNPDGTLRSYEQIQRKNQEDADKWRKESELCRQCEESK